MRRETVSQTALMVCAYRARATARPHPVCRDEWASALAGEEGTALAARFDARFGPMELWVALRTAYLDNQVRYWLDQGVRQVGILGAGFDTRAARLAREGVRFFEVDHPATQAEKRRRLAALPGYPLDAPRYCPCDFEQGEDFLATLAAGGFEPREPAVLLWEGVVPYLTEEAVRTTAGRVANGCHPGTVLYFDFLGKRLAKGLNLRDQDQQALRYVDELGEPIRFGSDDILPLLYDCGFRHVRVHDFNELALTLTGTYDRTREYRFQFVALASRTAPPVW
jgi:methyltransferase (TIGR00027 family)